MLLDLLLLDVRNIWAGLSSDYDDPVLYIGAVYNLAATRASKAPPLHHDAWLKLAQYVTHEQWETLYQIYTIFNRLYTEGTTSLMSIIPRGVSYWHIKCCLWQWLNGQEERLDVVVKLRCFLNLTPQESQSRLIHATKRNDRPYMYRLSTTQAGMITLSFVSPIGRVLHHRLDTEAVNRVSTQSDDLYAALFNETCLKLGQPLTMDTVNIVLALSTIGLKVHVQEIYNRLGEPPYECERLPTLLRDHFYNGLSTVLIKASSLNELVGLTESYVAAYMA
jgi:hypothetical protein